MCFHFTTLPFSRLQLERLARQSDDGVGPLHSGMTPEQAAGPTPQREA